LDVEEKVRAKDVSGKKVGEGSSSAYVVQKNPPKSHKKKFQQELKKSLPLLLRRRKRTRKRKIISLVASLGTMLESAKRLSGSQTRKQQTQLRLMQEQRGTVIYCLLFFQFIIHLIGGLILVQIYMCVLMFLCFLLIRSGRLPPC
jgi:hypothetical protein